MKVSIIVPFYNVEPYFRRCLDSIVNQSHHDLEIILVDDCSPDNSLAIAKEYADKDDRITIIRHEVNKGLGGARNSGVAQASGEYIWFIDSDDYIFSVRSIEQIVEALEQANYPEMVGFGAIKLFDDGYKELIAHVVEDKEIFDSQTLLQYIFKLNKEAQSHSPLDGYAWHKWFKRSFWQRMQMHFLEKILFEDIFLINVPSLAQGFLALQDPHYVYRKRAGSILASGYPIDFDAHIKRFVQQIIDLQKKHQQDMPMDYYNYTNLNMLAYGNFVGESWRDRLGETLKKEPDRAKQLYQVFQVLYSDLLANDPQLEQIKATGAMSADDLARLQRFIDTMRESNNQPDYYQIFNQLFQPKNHLIKDLIYNAMPFGLLKKVLAKRGWSIIIKSSKSLR